MSRAGRADLIVIGRIATLAGESGWGWQSGLAIADGRVIAVGSESEIEALNVRLAKTHNIKTGMLQQLLTGRTRLPVEVSS